MKNYARYSKAIVALIGTLATVLQTLWPAAHWSAAVTSGITAALIYLVPNAPAAPIYLVPKGTSAAPAPAPAEIKAP